MKKLIIILFFFSYIATSAQNIEEMFKFFLLYSGAGGVTNHYEDSLKTIYEDSFRQNDKNYLIYSKVDSSSYFKEDWVFQIHKNLFKRYHLVSNLGDFQFLCSADIRKLCNCKADVYIYDQTMEKPQWIHDILPINAKKKMIDYYNKKTGKKLLANKFSSFCDVIDYFNALK